MKLDDLVTLVFVAFGVLGCVETMKGGVFAKWPTWVWRIVAPVLMAALIVLPVAFTKFAVGVALLKFGYDNIASPIKRWLEKLWG